MKFQMENDFAKHVKGPELLRVYLLYGEQPYLIGLYEQQLIRKTLSGSFNDFNLHRFESGTFDLQVFYDAVESVPMFAENRCVTLDLEPDRLDAGAFQELCGVLADPPPTTTVVVTLRSGEGKKERVNALIKICDKAGGVISLGARGRSDMLRFLRNRAQKNRCELSSENAACLIERCSDDLQLLATEVDKLCAYVGAGTIDREAIEAVVIPVLQARVFDLSKAILGNRFARAMELLDQLAYLREPMPKVLAVLSGAFVDLFRGYAARQAGMSATQAAVDLGYPKNREFAIRNAMQESGRFHPRQLGQMLQTLADADLRLKSVSGDDRVILEQTIARLFLIVQD